MHGCASFLSWVTDAVTIFLYPPGYALRQGRHLADLSWGDPPHAISCTMVFIESRLIKKPLNLKIEQLHADCDPEWNRQEANHRGAEHDFKCNFC